MRIGGRAVEPQVTYDIVADEALVMNSEPLQGIEFAETGTRVDTMLIDHLRKIRIIENRSPESDLPD
jgi:hypothetical protein